MSTLLKTLKPQELKRLSAKKVEQTIGFINSLKHVKDPFHGQPFELLDWEEKIIRDVYGTLKPTGFRKYKHAWLEIPKKQGKSEFLAAIGLKQTCADDEYAAEVYGCAADRGQASIIFDVAVNMLDQLLEDEPELKPRFKLVLSQKRIVYYPTKSFYQVLSAEAYTKHGLNVSTVLFDEIHAQPNRDLYDVMTFGSGDARTQPLYWYITTAGDDPDRQSIAWELHKKAEGILLGNIKDPTWYPVIFGYDEEERRIWKGWDYEIAEKGEDWKSRRIWHLVNPSINKTVAEEKLEEAFASVKGNEAEEKKFKWLRLNVWCKYKSTKWVTLEAWDATSGLVVPEKLRGRKCYGGLDLSSKIDISAFKLLFPPVEDDPYWRSLSWFWIPVENMKQRVKRDGVRYDEWVKQGLIKATDGNSIDYYTIEQDIIKLKDLYDIKEIAYDPWNAYQMAQNLTEAGFVMVEVRQGYKSMSEPMKTLEALILDKKYQHGGNPVDRWMFGNLEVKKDENENIRPIKDKRGKSRIDGIVALINAMARAILHEKEEPLPGIVFL